MSLQDDQPDLMTFLKASTTNDANFEDPNKLTMGDFPTDIIAYLIIILQEECGRSTLFNLSLVNKEFYLLFSPVLYENLEITEWNIRKIFQGMLIEADEREEYVEVPALRLIVEPKPTISNEEIIESLGCLAMCFGPRKPTSKPKPKKDVDYTKIRNLGKLVREVERLQVEQRESDFKKYQGTSFAGDIMSKWKRKVNLLNSVKNLRIKDIVALREMAAYLGPTQEEDSFPNVHTRSAGDFIYEEPLVFKNLKTLSFGSRLLISTVEEGNKNLTRDMSLEDDLAGLANPPNLNKSMNRMLTKLEPEHLCGYWDTSNGNKVNKDRMIWLRDLNFFCGVWKIKSFTWHIYEEKRLFKDANRVEELESQRESSGKPIQSDLLDVVTKIPLLKIIYNEICTCTNDCSSPRYGTDGQDQDPCWRELGQAAIKIDHLGYGSPSHTISSSTAPSSDTPREDDRTIQLVGLPCLTNLTPEDIVQAAIEQMEKMGFDGTEISLAKRRWSDRYDWTKDHLRVVGTDTEGCVCCRKIEEDKMSNGFYRFGFMMGKFARRSGM